MNNKLSISYQELCQSSDYDTSIRLENQFFANVITRFLLAAGIFSTFGSIIFFRADNQRAFLDGAGLVIFAVIFWLSSKIFTSEKFKMYIFSGLLFTVLLYTLLRFYYLIGPAVWTISFLIGVTLLIYSKSTMIINYSISNIPNLVWSASTNVFLQERSIHVLVAAISKLSTE